MPKMTKERRTQGGWSALTDAYDGRHYGRDDQGDPCDVCGLPMVKALNAAGITKHPTCGRPS